MKELNFDFEVKQIKINGNVFDILKSDIDVLERADSLLQGYEKELTNVTADTEEGRKTITNAIFEARDYIDEMLGDGALHKIANGKPVGLVQVIDIMREIAAAVVQTYQEDLGDEYALDGDKPKESQKAKPKAARPAAKKTK